MDYINYILSVVANFKRNETFLWTPKRIVGPRHCACLMENSALEWLEGKVRMCRNDTGGETRAGIYVKNDNSSHDENENEEDSKGHRLVNRI